MAAPNRSSVVPLAGLRLLVAASDIAVLVLRTAALANAGARVHAASSLSAALHALSGKPPIDAAVLEMGLPGGALALESRLRLGVPPVLSVVISPSGAAQGPELLALGVAAHVPSPALAHALVPAVREVALATGALRVARGRRGASTSAPDPRAGVDRAVHAMARRRGLSPRERSVLRYIALGYRYEEIGRRLAIATRTVKMHAESLRRKTGASTRRDLVREVFER